MWARRGIMHAGTSDGPWHACSTPVQRSMLVGFHAVAGGVSRAGVGRRLYVDASSVALSSACPTLAVNRVGCCSRRGFDLPIVYELCSCVVREW